MYSKSDKGTQDGRFLVSFSTLSILITWFFSQLSPVYGQTSNPILFELTVNSSLFHVGEPVSFDLSIINQSTDTVEFGVPSLETQTVVVAIKKGDGNFVTIDSGLIDEPFTSPLLLVSGESFFDQIALHLNENNDQLIFSEASTYTIRATLNGYFSPESLRPDGAEITIEVTDNEPEEQAFADFFSQSETAAFFTNTSRAPDVISQLEALIAQYPNSLYVPYSQYFLALYQARRFHDREPNLFRAVELMTAADVDGFQLQADAILQLGDWHWQLGDGPTAFALLDRCIAEFAGTSAAFRAGILRAKLDGATPPEPPPPEALPLDNATQNAVESLLSNYFSAFEQQDIATMLSLLDSNFRYNDLLGRDDMTSQWTEDFTKLAGASLTISQQPIRQVSIEGTPFLDVRVSFLADGSLISEPQEISIGFVDVAGTWFIESWNRI